ncbi:MULTISPECIES: SpoIIE family protein phosphatase [Streptomyces]|uniref:SpoIIE family protein phosphatase n=1 Tax=Streptomyces TaxID=1883 RepID=UPI000CD508F7|nr:MULTISPECIES: SpoIIE family protein phosphatase [Streptomyces]
MAGHGEELRGGSDPEGVSEAPGSLLEQIQAAAFLLDADGRIRLWGAEAETLFGHRAADVLGAYAGRVLVAHEHLALVTDWFQRVRDGAGWSGVFPVRRGDGTIAEVEFRHRRLLDESGRVLVLALAADAGAVRRLETDLALSTSLISQSPVGLGMVDTELRWLRVNPALARAGGATPSELLGREIGGTGGGLDVPQVAAAMRRVMADGDALPDQQVTGTTPADPGAEHVWSASYYRVEDPAGRPLGAATSVVDVTERHRASAEVAEAREQLAMIADAGRRIGTTLDLQHTAQELADVIVPRLADLAAVDVLDSVFSGEVVPPVAEDGSARFRALAVASAEAHSDAETAADRVGALASYGPHRPITQCVAEARPILLPEVGPRTLLRIARDEGAARVLARSGVHSYLAVPLVARGDILGTLSLCRTHTTPRPFDERDLALAVDLAGRAAICVDNARLYSRERNAALTLQRGLLPRMPEEPLALDLAFRYLPAVREVGGDWFDVLPLRHGRVGLMIGDVMGKGVHAAAIMGQLRSTTRALARLDLPPAELLGHLDATAEYLGDSIATCVYAVCDPVAGWCELAVAGHLPPIVIGPGGQAELLDLPVAAPLGVGAGGFTAERLPLPHRATLAMFTDGLVEDRHTSIDVGLSRLRRLLTGHPLPLEETCDRVLAALHRAPQDDVALLLARPHGDLAAAGAC